MRAARLSGIFATAVAIAVGLAGLPASANAAQWQNCASTIDLLECANFTMPRDRTGVFDGETTVRAIRQPAREGPRLGTLFVIAGGPGQSSLVMLELMDQLFTGANRYDIVAVDQRGSGMSEPLVCPQLDSGLSEWGGSDPALDGPVTACSDSLGGARGSYNTYEAVEDLETVRADLGVENATFFGISYGTKVAMAYAKAHPNRTKALLLDSVLPTDMPETFDLESLAALRGALERICASGRCRGVSTQPVSDTQRLATQLARRPVATRLTLPQGGGVSVAIDDKALHDIIFTADFNPFIYSQLPSMLKAALAGDNAQLKRLYAVAFGVYGVTAPSSDSYNPYRFSTAMFLATTCADFDPPWTRGAVLTGRQQAIESAAALIPEDLFSPFPRETAVGRSTSALCRGWQQEPIPPPIVQGPLPEIPTLALSGELDLRTPVSWAQSAVAGNSLARVVSIPNAGHSVVSSDISKCALSFAKRFLVFGTTDGGCKDTAPPIPVAPAAPRSLGAVRAAKGSCRRVAGKRCRALLKSLTASYLAVRDSFDQLLIGGVDSGPGLYGGQWSLDYESDEELSAIIPSEVSLRRLASVPGAATTGTINVRRLPRVEGRVRIYGIGVKLAGKIAYNRAGDALVLTMRRGRMRASIRIRPRAKSVLSGSASTLALRRSLKSATVPPLTR